MWLFNNVGSNQIAYRFVYNRIKLCLMFHHHHHHHHQTIHVRVYPILRHALITLWNSKYSLYVFFFGGGGFDGVLFWWGVKFWPSRCLCWIFDGYGIILFRESPSQSIYIQYNQYMHCILIMSSFCIPLKYPHESPEKTPSIQINHHEFPSLIPVDPQQPPGRWWGEFPRSGVGRLGTKQESFVGCGWPQLSRKHMGVGQYL